MNPMDCDVLASGGGMAGTVAAIAAARQGARTVLFERHGFLGGAATAGAVGQFVGWETRAGRRVIAGLAEEIVGRLEALGGSSGHGHFVMSTGHHMDRVEYDTEILKVVLDEMAHEADVRVLLHSQLAQVSRRGRAITSATLLTKGGMLEARARFFIDSSGDLDLMARAGAPLLGLDAGETLQPATMMFRLGPIDFSAFDGMSAETKAALAAHGVAQGALPRAVRIVTVADGKVDPAALLGLGVGTEDDIANRRTRHDSEPEHDHDDFASFVMALPELSDPAALVARIAHLAETHKVLRLKGFAAVKDKPMRLLIQAVGPRVSHYYDRLWGEAEPRQGNLVVIGLKGLDRDAVERTLRG